MTTAAPPRPGLDGRDTTPLTVERYVLMLYPRLAWEATLRLGDPSTAGRLVERVLHRAWRERERFAASDALLRHASESAEAAIAREEARRLAVTRFDSDEGALGFPGDLSPLSLQAVSERLRSGRAPVATPTNGVQPIAAPSAHLSAPPAMLVDVPAPVAVEQPSHTSEVPAAAALRDTGLHPRPGRASWATPHTPGATAEHRANGAATETHKATGTGHKTHLRSAQYIAKPSRRLSLRTMGLIAGGALVAVVALWRLTAGPSGVAAARLAAADSTAPTITTARGERRDTLLIEGLTAALGPSSSVSAPAALREGIRGVAANGFVALTAAVDSAHPLVVTMRGQRFETPGGRLSLVAAGDSVFVFAESGDVTHHAAAVSRIPDGQTVLVTPSGEISGAERSLASRLFAWRSGRLVTDRLPIKALRAPLGTWFGLELSTDVTDSLALDVPLDSAAALPARLEAAGLTATLDGKTLKVEGNAPRPRAVAARRAPAAPVVADIELPVLRKLPGIPEPPTP